MNIVSSNHTSCAEDSNILLTVKFGSSYSCGCFKSLPSLANSHMAKDTNI